MTTIKLKTNIMCSSCIEKVTPTLNEELGAENWNVDTTAPQKILTATSDKTAKEVIKAIEKAGYKAEELAQ